MSNLLAIPYAPRKWQKYISQQWVGYNRVVLVIPRRHGKTYLLIRNKLIPAALQKQNGRFAYIAPQLSQAKKIAWDEIKQSLKDFPDSIIKYNEAELKVTILPTNTIIYLLGAENGESIRGMGLDGVILDEMQDINKSFWEKTVSPTLENRPDSWVVFCGTPKGRNYFYELYQKSRDPDLKAQGWFGYKSSADKMGVFTPERLEQLRLENSEGTFNQEYMCSFDAANEGAVYARQLEYLRDRHQITNIPYNPDLPVHTAIDMGFKDKTSVWFFQIKDGVIYCIDYLEDEQISLVEWAKIIREKPFNYGSHIAPHDMMKRDGITTHMTRRDIMESHGVYFDIIVPKSMNVMEDIEVVRRTLPKVYFDEINCGDGLECLKQYAFQTVEKDGVLSTKPKHDKYSHGADSFRYLCQGWEQIPEDADGYNPAEEVTDWDPLFFD